MFRDMAPDIAVGPARERNLTSELLLIQATISWQSLGRALRS
jgi:hypothetical protein